MYKLNNPDSNSCLVYFLICLNHNRKSYSFPIKYELHGGYMKHRYQFIIVSILTLVLSSCQLNYTKQIVYQNENDRVIKFVLNEDKITKIGLRELKSSIEYGNRELLLEEYYRDLEFFQNLDNIYLTSDTINFIDLSPKDGYAISVQVEDDIIDPKYAQNTDIGYSVTVIIDFNQSIDTHTLNQILSYYELSESSMSNNTLSYSKLMDDSNFRFHEVIKLGKKTELE